MILVLVVQIFKRSGMDLIMKMDISLTESLCGMKKTIETLDARTLVIQTVPGTARLLARDVSRATLLFRSNLFGSGSKWSLMQAWIQISIVFKYCLPIRNGYSIDNHETFFIT